MYTILWGIRRCGLAAKMLKRYCKLFFILIYYLSYSAIYMGWLFHRSLSPTVLCYSTSYFLFLAGMSFFFFLPIIISVCVKRIGLKNLFFGLSPVFILLFLLYFGFSIRYYYTQEHLFDPFLQSPFEKFDVHSGAKSANTFRIICLGGSTTKNLALSPEKRYPALLGNTLQKSYPSKNIEVLNAGTPWYTTKHSLISYVTYYSDLEADLIIVMHAINDLARSFSPVDFAIGEYNDFWTHFYGPAIRGAKPPTFEKHFLLRFETPMNAWYSKQRFKEKDYPKERYLSLPAFEENLLKLVQSVKNNKTQLLLVTQPSLYKQNMPRDEQKLLYFGKTIANTRINFLQIEYPSPPSFQMAMELFNESTKKIAEGVEGKGAMLVDAASIVEKNTMNFRDDVHYTDEGAKRLSGIIAEKIIEEKLILP